MPTLIPDKEFPTDESTFLVENKLLPGDYTFALEVEDKAGNRSANTAKVIITIIDDKAPTASLIARIGNKQIKSAPVGTAFTLDGSKSTDEGPGGGIAKYHWTLLKTPNDPR